MAMSSASSVVPISVAWFSTGTTTVRWRGSVVIFESLRAGFAREPGEKRADVRRVGERDPDSCQQADPKRVEAEPAEERGHGDACEVDAPHADPEVLTGRPGEEEQPPE